MKNDAQGSTENIHWKAGLRIQLTQTYEVFLTRRNILSKEMLRMAKKTQNN